MRALELGDDENMSNLDGCICDRSAHKRDYATEGFDGDFAFDVACGAARFVLYSEEHETRVGIHPFVQELLQSFRGGDRLVGKPLERVLLILECRDI